MKKQHHFFIECVYIYINKNALSIVYDRNNRNALDSRVDVNYRIHRKMVRDYNIISISFFISFCLYFKTARTALLYVWLLYNLNDVYIY